MECMLLPEAGGEPRMFGPTNHAKIDVDSTKDADLAVLKVCSELARDMGTLCKSKGTRYG